MSLFEENENILTQIEEAEARLEKIKIDGVATATNEEKKEVATEIKRYVIRLVKNIEVSNKDVQALGGALVVADLIEVLKRYGEVFQIPNLAQSLETLEKMWENSKK